jgi:uncharacterized protein (DUF1778 family)
MTEGKNISVSFRVSPRFKQMLEVAAVREHRSLTNMLETLLFAYCVAHDIQAAEKFAVAKKTAKAKGAKE